MIWHERHMTYFLKGIVPELCAHEEEGAGGGSGGEEAVGADLGHDGQHCLVAGHVCPAVEGPQWQRQLAVGDSAHTRDILYCLCSVSPYLAVISNRVMYELFVLTYLEQFDLPGHAVQRCYAQL